MTSAEYRQLRQKPPATPRTPATQPTAPATGRKAQGREETGQVGQAPATGERDTVKERPAPAGHRARYAHTTGPPLPYQGARFIADDVPLAALNALIAAAQAAGLTPY